MASSQWTTTNKFEVETTRNLVAGLASSIWSALISLAVVPLYLKYLGIEAYGLIGVFATLQALLQLLDMGMAPTINREVARCSALGNLQEAGTLLHTLAVIYWAIAGIITLSILLIAPLIATHWLQAKQLAPETISHAIMLMGLVVACRFPIGLYQGALIGAQRLDVSSGISIAMVTVGNLGAVAVLAFVSPSIEAFFIWQACAGLVYAAVMRVGAWRIIGSIRGNHFDINALKRIWRFTVGMSGVALSGIALSQLDKLILSKILNLDAFGHYMLATVLVSSMYVLISPVFNVIYPRFSVHVASKDIEGLIDLYRTGTRLLASVLFPIAMFFVIFGHSLVLIWIGNQSIASSVAPIIALLAVGSALHGIMYFPYSLQLAFGNTRLPLTIYLVLIILLVPLIIFFSLEYGALGGAMAWLALHTIYMMLSTWLTHQQLLIGLGGRWLVIDVGIPLALSAIVGLTWHYTTQHRVSSDYLSLAFGVIIVLIAFIISVFATPKLRMFVINKIRSIQLYDFKLRGTNV